MLGAWTLRLCLPALCASLVRPSRYVNITGDVILGGLFPVHAIGKGVTECGLIQVQDGLQMLEAMIFVVNEINLKKDLLPGINLGVIAYDSCDSPAYALEQSLDFIKGKMLSKLENIIGFIAHFNENEHHKDHPKEFVCRDNSAPEYRGGNFDKVVALIGEQSSAVTTQLATMLRLFGTPIVSYMATSSALSQHRFPTFFRTVPSDDYQARAMLELIRHFNWTYVSIVYSDSEYGNQGYEELKKLAANYSVCFSMPHRVSTRSEHFTEDDYDDIVEKLSNNTAARVVVVFAEKPVVVLNLVESTKRKKVANRFVWVGSHGWTVTEHSEQHLLKKPPDVESHEVLEGALAIQPLAGHLDGFDEYFSHLTVESHGKINPWFKEYWETFFNCIFKNETDIFTSEEHLNKTDCESLNKTISLENGYQQHSLLHFVRDAVYAVATALHRMHHDKCGDAPGLCDNMSHIENSQVVEYLKNITIKDQRGNSFKFMNGSDGPPRYSILNFQRDQVGNTFQWQIVGNYTFDEMGEPQLFLDKERTRFGRKERFFPPSHCKTSCSKLQIKIRQYEDTCCWSCVNCGSHEMKTESNSCKECEEGHLPSINKTICVEIPETYINYTDSWATSAIVVSAVGIVLTGAVSCVFWTNADTPVVKASGRELSYILLLGTLMEFSLTFIMVAPPTFASCVITRFFLGFSFTLCYAAIVTKTNRIARIFSSGENMHRTRYTSPGSQILITSILTSVQIVINIGWFLYDPPEVIHVFPDHHTRLRTCSGLGDFSYLIGLSYPFVLIAVCTVYAFLTRKCPDGFNEARHIGFTNYTAIVIWLAFVPLYIAATSYNIRVVTLALSLALSGFVQLGCLFLPKLYIVLLTPEKNTKEVVMAHNRTSSFSVNQHSVSSNNIGPAAATPDINRDTGFKNPTFSNSVSSIQSEDASPMKTIRFHPVVSVVNPKNHEEFPKRPLFMRTNTPTLRTSVVSSLPDLK